MIIYGIENIITGKWYIGQTINAFYQRKAEHVGRLKKGKHRNKHLQASWEQYGESSFVFTALASARHELELNDLEKIYIGLYDSFKNGYNKTSGGKRYFRHSEESRKKISEAGKGNTIRLGKKLSEETRKKQSEAMKGRPSHCRGKKLSEEHRRKISESLKGNTRAKGKTHSAETLEILKNVNLGLKHEKVQCSICNKFVAKNTITRFHNQNCKLNLEEKINVL